MSRWGRFILIGGAGTAVLALAAIHGADYYYRGSWGEGCAKCHEIRPNHQAWLSSSHRRVNCLDCHTSSLSSSLRRVVKHFSGEIPERIRLASADVQAMVPKCANCHRQEFAQWRAGPHSTTYARLFLDPEHNAKRRLMDDCLRCHGMHFEGSIRDIVTPIDSKGPWRLTETQFITRWAIPCLSCHAIHTKGEPMAKGSRIGTRQETFRPSISLFDRRSGLPIELAHMAAPEMFDGSRKVRMSPDPRQALCYQCHAPLASRAVGSGDDRTPIGVHEGLSCLACHQKHGQFTRASCAGCHPRLSNCGLDVEKMDTTYKDPKSRFDIHFVKCADCHAKGVPARRAMRAAD